MTLRPSFAAIRCTAAGRSCEKAMRARVALVGSREFCTACMSNGQLMPDPGRISSSSKLAARRRLSVVPPVFGTCENHNNEWGLDGSAGPFMSAR